MKDALLYEDRLIYCLYKIIHAEKNKAAMTQVYQCGMNWNGQYNGRAVVSVLGSEQARRSGPVPGHLCQDLLFAYKSIYIEINNGILIRGLDPSLCQY